MMVFGLVAGVASGEVKVELAGLQVTATGYVPEGENEFNSLRAFNRQLGTKVGVLVTSSDKAIVKLDEEKSKVTVFLMTKRLTLSKLRAVSGERAGYLG